MAITNFIPELWSAAVLVPYADALVAGQPSVSNTDYEGEIKAQGDTVRITSISAPSIRAYNKAADITVDDVNDAGQTLEIDQGDYFAFRVNDVDEVQAAGKFDGIAVQEAGRGLALEADAFLLDRMVNGAGSVNATPVDISVDGAAYNTLKSLRLALNKASAPLAGRFVIVSAEFADALLDDPRFVEADKAGTDEGLRNGLVGRALGMDILETNAAPTILDGDDDVIGSQVIAGVPGATTRASQILQTEAIRSEHRFADIVRGLHVYGGRVIRPAGLAVQAVGHA